VFKIKNHWVKCLFKVKIFSAGVSLCIVSHSEISCFHNKKGLNFLNLGNKLSISLILNLQTFELKLFNYVALLMFAKHSNCIETSVHHSFSHIRYIFLFSVWFEGNRLKSSLPSALALLGEDLQRVWLHPGVAYRGLIF